MPSHIANAYPTIKRHIDDLDYQIFDLDDVIEELRERRELLEAQRAAYQHHLRGRHTP
jgi:hypothetical protein